jgi:hypothetical protein
MYPSIFAFAAAAFRAIAFWELKHSTPKKSSRTERTCANIIRATWRHHELQVNRDASFHFGIECG